MSGGEAGVRGFLDAYDAATGERVWRWWAVPAPGETGGDTWEGDAWKTGGGATWLTGSFDPELGLLYWGIGNPAPDWNGDVRPGDNLYTCSLGGPRGRHRGAALALPVHPARHPRLGREPDPGAGGRGMGRNDAQAGDPRQPQRVLLCARPRNRPVPAGDPVCDADLGGTDRRERTPGAHSGHGPERGGHAGVAEPRGGHELGTARPTTPTGRRSSCRPARWRPSTSRAMSNTSRGRRFSVAESAGWTARPPTGRSGRSTR